MAKQQKKSKPAAPRKAASDKPTTKPEPAVIARAPGSSRARPAAPAKAPASAKATRVESKLARLEAMLRRDGGVTIEALSKELDWQSHSVRGAISGSLKKKQGLSVESSKDAAGVRTYRIVG